MNIMVITQQILNWFKCCSNLSLTITLKRIIKLTSLDFPIQNNYLKSYLAGHNS